MTMPRKPAAAHWLNGTKSQATAQEGSPLPAGRARFPKGFSAREKQIFKSLAAQLEQRQHSTCGDAALLEVVARVWARWQRALEHLAAEGEVVQVETYGKDGSALVRLKPNPWLLVAQQSERAILKGLVECGLTPQARDKVKRTAAKPTAEMDDEEAFAAFEKQLEQQGAARAN